MTRHRALMAAALAASLLLCACGADLDGLLRTPPGSGPSVVFDLEAKPLPELPFPNDLATRADPSSLTGRRVNASLVATIGLERRVRQKIDQLDGFGTLQPVSVAFDAPLDIDDLLARHRDNINFTDDAVYLINIDRQSVDFGKPVLLDIGRGNYPLTLKSSSSYFDADPRAGAGNVLFETVEEDLNGNGVLDPGEDTDDDGVLDHPNVWPPGADPVDGLMTFYESETNTLIMKPVVPLRERSRYAVVLTRRLKGRNGQPVRSPFPFVHHHSQTEALAALEDALMMDGGRYGLPRLGDVAFTWVYSTQAVTAEIVAVREGLHGIGPLAWLEDQYPVDAVPDRCLDAKQEPPFYVLPADMLLDIFSVLGEQLLGEYMSMAQPFVDSFAHVDYFASGSFVSPDFLRTGEDGRDPAAVHEENFDVDLKSGRAEVESKVHRLIIAVPKETAEHKAPFPVVVYCHSYSSFRAESLGFAGFMAREGFATVGIDAWGHGLPLDYAVEELIIAFGKSYGFLPFAETLLHGRARDLNGNGAMDSGGDYWTAYAFHTRDVVRQSVVDHFQLIRVLRGFDGTRTWELDQDGDGKDDLAGDFNGDGKVDLGGPDAEYYAWGQSGGGIHSAVLGPLEPRIRATAPTAGGGGLSDVGMRTMLGGVRNAVMLRTMGPLVLGEPTGDGGLRVFMRVALSNENEGLHLGTVQGVEPGDRVAVKNLDTMEEFTATVQTGRRFRVSMAADRDDWFRVIFRDPRGREITRIERFERDATFGAGETPNFHAGDPLRTPTEGFGIERCTPDLRRFVGLFQMILEPADPANFATHYFLDPLDIRPEGPTTTNILEVVCLGDQDVPIQTQATIGRAAGVIEHLDVEPRFGMTPNDWLIANHVYEGLARLQRFPGTGVQGDGLAVFDPDDLDDGADGFNAPEPGPEGPLRATVSTATGESGVRFAYMLPEGQHGVFPTGEDPDFDMFSYFVNMVGRYFASGSTEILDDTCLESASCAAP